MITKFNVGMECQRRELCWILTLKIDIFNNVDICVAISLTMLPKDRTRATPTTIVHNKLFASGDQ